MSVIKDCLIVAAGMGTRLKTHGDLKPLTKVCGKPLIEHAMEAASAGGVQRFVIVTGYKASLLDTALMEIRDRRGWAIETVYNAQFERPNGVSVLAGEALLPTEFFLAMCDHIVDAAIYRRVSAITLPKNSVALGVDYRLSNPDVDIDDVTKVQTANNHIKAIGKTIALYNAFDTGIFRANASLFTAIRASERKNGDCSISGGMEVLAKYNQAIAVDIGNARWMDVDSPEMYQRAHDWLFERIDASSDVRAALL
ncbi:MAG: NTP transferase domain-containing protein [Marinicaulis sp.]|nr:NTP transferase domain-containing protein [Marinicaulis sp.]